MTLPSTRAKIGFLEVMIVRQNYCNPSELTMAAYSVVPIPI